MSTVSIDVNVRYKHTFKLRALYAKTRALPCLQVAGKKIIFSVFHRLVKFVQKLSVIAHEHNADLD